MATVVLLTNKKGSRLEKILDKALEKTVKVQELFQLFCIWGAGIKY